MRYSSRGLEELSRALSRAGRNLRRRARDELREIAGDVADDARRIAGERTERHTGDLVDGIVAGPLPGRGQQFGFAVESTAEHDGYPYPTRLEFQGRGEGALGPHASLTPAVEANRQDIERRLDGVLEDTIDDIGSNRP